MLNIAFSLLTHELDRTFLYTAAFYMHKTQKIHRVNIRCSAFSTQFLISVLHWYYYYFFFSQELFTCFLSLWVRVLHLTFELFEHFSCIITPPKFSVLHIPCFRSNFCFQFPDLFSHESALFFISFFFFISFWNLCFQLSLSFIVFLHC